MHAKRNFGISKEINTLFLNTKDFRHLELQVSKSFVLKHKVDLFGDSDVTFFMCIFAINFVLGPLNPNNKLTSKHFSFLIYFIHFYFYLASPQG